MKLLSSIEKTKAKLIFPLSFNSSRWRSSRAGHPGSPLRAGLGASQLSRGVRMDAGRSDTGLAKLPSPVAFVDSGGILAPSPAF